jgi:hypothetical protein
MTDSNQEKINRYRQFLMNSTDQEKINRWGNFLIHDPTEFYTNLKGFDNFPRIKKLISNKTLEENIKLHNLITKLNELSLSIRNNNLDNRRIYNVLSYISFKLNSSFDKVETNIILNELLNMINNIIYLLYVKSNIDYESMNVLITNTLKNISISENIRFDDFPIGVYNKEVYTTDHTANSPCIYPTNRETQTSDNLFGSSLPTSNNQLETSYADYIYKTTLELPNKTPISSQCSAFSFGVPNSIKSKEKTEIKDSSTQEIYNNSNPSPFGSSSQPIQQNSGFGISSNPSPFCSLGFGSSSQPIQQNSGFGVNQHNSVNIKEDDSKKNKLNENNELSNKKFKSVI